MVDWWSEIDEAVLACLETGPMAPKDIGRRLGLSEDAVASIVAMLAGACRVRISLVELPGTSASRSATSGPNEVGDVGGVTHNR